MMFFNSLFRNSGSDRAAKATTQAGSADYSQLIIRVRDLYFSNKLQDDLLREQCEHVFGPIVPVRTTAAVPDPVESTPLITQPPVASAAPQVEMPHERSLSIMAGEQAPPASLRIKIKSAEAQIPAKLSLPRAEEHQIFIETSTSPASRAKRILAIDKQTSPRTEPVRESFSSIPRSVKVVSHIAVHTPTTTSSGHVHTTIPEDPVMVRVADLQSDQDMSGQTTDELSTIKRQIKPTLRFS